VTHNIGITGKCIYSSSQKTCFTASQHHLPSEITPFYPAPDTAGHIPS